MAKKPAKPNPGANVSRLNLPLGPVTPKPGSRLKGAGKKGA